MWAAGDFNDQVIENTRRAQYKIRAEIKNVAGVKLPVFDRVDSQLSQDSLVGLSKGGQQINKCKSMYVV